MLKVPVKNLLSKKKLAWLGHISADLQPFVMLPFVFVTMVVNRTLRFKKLKNGMKVQPLPEKPDSLPTKPPSAQRIFFSEKRTLGCVGVELQRNIVQLHQGFAASS